MTANPQRPARYRPGKGQDVSSASESESEEEQEQEQTPAPPKFKSAPRPGAQTSKVTSALRDVSVSERRAQEAARLEAEKAAAQAINEEDFETESENEGDAARKDSKASSAGSGSEASGSSAEESSSGEESSSEDETPKKLLRPTFISKTKRSTAPTTTQTPEQIHAQEEARRKEAATALVQEQLERNAALRAASKKDWDADDEDFAGETGVAEADIDDTDGVHPEAEYASWKLRELTRIKRERTAIEDAEKEREEIERRRNLSKEERDAEDAAHIAAQKEEQEGRGKAGFMQRYFHKGAFFQDDAYAKGEGLDKRDIMGSRFADQVAGREMLPEYLQVRDMAKVGRKGRTKYRDLKSEDTGRWGEFGDRDRKGGGGGFGGRGEEEGIDERFRSDAGNGRGSGREGPSGANTVAVGEKRRDRAAPEDAPRGPKGEARIVRNSDEGLRRSERSRSGSRTPRPRKERRESQDRERRRDSSRDRKGPDSRDRKRRDSRDKDDQPRYRRSSPSPRRDRRRDSRDRDRDRERRKRSASPYYRHKDRYDAPDKRQKVS
ncbi:hypothetical protein MMC10_006464 [Thelotrema lepadinum]|nr:hypothetical protein [Thelotrema lepadinum]